MTRFKPHTLVVPVLGGLLPTATVPTDAARWAGARHRASRRRVGAQAAHGHPRIAGPTRTTASHAVSTRRATATVPLRNAPRITEIKRRRRRRPAAMLSLGAVGLALAVAGCGSAVSGSGN